VFISHATKDTWIARHIASDIEKTGKRKRVTTFLDARDIRAGEVFNDSIRRNLQECSKFLVLLSSASVTRPWVIFESGAADLLGKAIIPILDKLEPSEIPGPLARYQAVDLNDLEKHLAHIAGTK
jgi:hypothetical protein